MEHRTKQEYKKNKRFALSLSKDQKKQNNKYENQFKLLLDSAGIIYEWQRPVYNDQKAYVVDFYLPVIKVVVEIDGFSHSRNKGRDMQRTQFLLKFKNISSVLRVKNHELKTRGIELVKYLKILHKKEIETV